ESARRWQLDTREQDRSGCGVGISGPVRLAKIAELRLSNLQLQELDVAVLDLSGINAGLRSHQANQIDGVLGADVLLSREAIIEVAPAMLHLLRDSAPL
ncbi:MAG: hypothetical protein P8Y44_06695, partial [Acidobacteriota bacterium]